MVTQGEAARLTIVVGSRAVDGPVAPCLDALARQKGPGIRIVLAQDAPGGGHPAADEVVVREHALVPELWAAGLEAAEGPVVALTASTVVPDDGWMDAVLSRHHDGVGCVGGPIEPGAFRRSTDWAVYFCRYAAFMLPIREGFVAEVAGDNAAYKRRAIDACRDAWQEGFWEPAVHLALRRAGERLWLAPDAVVSHRRSFGFGRFVQQRFLHGMRYGGDRCRVLTPARRWLRLAAGPLIPAIFLVRIVRNVTRKRRHMAKLVLSVPLLLPFLLAWSAGEMAGYVRGPRR